MGSPSYLITSLRVPCLHSSCPLPTGSGNHHARPPTCLPLVSGRHDTGLTNRSVRTVQRKEQGRGDSQSVSHQPIPSPGPQIPEVTAAASTTLPSGTCSPDRPGLERPLAADKRVDCASTPSEGARKTAAAQTKVRSERRRPSYSVSPTQSAGLGVKSTGEESSEVTDELSHPATCWQLSGSSARAETRTAVAQELALLSELLTN
ncbi:uncharacterized protein RBU33_020847 isoform 2-T2 [Hipposideros larvatus]